MTGDLFGELSGAINFFAVDFDDHISNLNTTLFGSAFGSNIGHIDTTLFSDTTLLTLFAFEETLVDFRILDTEDCTLYDTILFQVHHDFLHDRGRDGEGVSDIATRFRLDQRVDSHQLSFRIHQGTATVSRINGSIGLNKRLETILRLQRIEITSLCADNTGRNGIGQSVRTTDCQHPLSQTQVIGVSDREGWQIRCVDFDQRHFGGRIRTDQFCIESPLVIQCDFQFGCIFDDVVIRNDIPVGADNHTRSTALLHPRLLPFELTSGDTEEIKELLITTVSISVSHCAFAGIDDIYHRFNGIFCCIGQIGIGTLIIRGKMRTDFRSKRGGRIHRRAFCTALLFFHRFRYRIGRNSTYRHRQE